MSSSISATRGCTHSDRDGTRQHRGRHPRVLGGVVDQHAVEPLDELLEGLVLGQQPHDDGVELQGARHAATLDGKVDDPVEQHLSCPGWVVVRLGCLQRLLETPEFALGERDDDLLLGFELVVDGRLGDSDGVGDHLQRGSADSVLGDQPQCGVQDACLRGAAGDETKPAPGLRHNHTESLADRLLTVG